MTCSMQLEKQICGIAVKWENGSSEQFEGVPNGKHHGDRSPINNKSITNTSSPRVVYRVVPGSYSQRSKSAGNAAQPIPGLDYMIFDAKAADAP